MLLLPAGFVVASARPAHAQFNLKPRKINIPKNNGGDRDPRRKFKEAQVKALKNQRKLDPMTIVQKARHALAAGAR